MAQRDGQRLHTGYYKQADMKSAIERIDEWYRRRLRIPVNQRTAVYRTVRTVVWKVKTGNNPVSPTRLLKKK
jgi:hypothetical protein